MLFTLCTGNVIAEDVTDVITVSDLKATDTNYKDFSDVSKTSGAKYAGNSAKGNSAIQFNSSSPRGLVSTTSGGIVKSISISWESHTSDGRTLDVYGSNTAYSSAADLYNSSYLTQGVKLGSIVKGTSTSLTVVGDFKYIGLRSNSSAMYITSISITWAEEDNPDEYYYTLLTDASSLSSGDKIIILNTGGTSALSTTQGTNSRTGVTAADNNWSISDDKTTVTLGASTTVEVMTIGISNSHKVFISSTGYLYAASSSANQLKTRGANNDANGEWTISLNGSNEATITAQGSSTHNLLQFSSNVFNCYTSAQTAVKIYKRVPRPYTVTWVAGSNDSFYTQTDVAGTALEDPDEPSAGTYCPGGKVFVGWTATEIDGENEDSPDDLFTSVSGMTIPSGGATYYAVFAAEDDNSSVDEWVLCTSTSDITTGTYVITYNNSYYLPSETTANKNPAVGSGITASNGKLTNTVTSAMQWSFSGSSSGWTVSHTSGNTTYYLGSTDTSQGILVATTNNSYIWTVGANSSPYSGLHLRGAGSTRYLVVYNNATWRYYTDSGYEGEVALYKLSSGTAYTDYATTCASSYTLTLKDTNGSQNGDAATVTANATTFDFGSTAPSKTGYHVDGFYKESGLTNRIADAKVSAGVVTGGDFCASTAYTDGDKKYTAGADNDLYLKWEANTYSITLDDEGATTPGSTSVTLTYDANTHTAISNPVKTGYTFDGWYSGDDGTGSLVIAADGTMQSNVSVSDVQWTGANGIWKKAGAVTLHAKWTVNWKFMYNGDSYAPHTFGNNYQLTQSLSGNTTYYFRISDGGSTSYDLDGTSIMDKDNCTEWEFLKDRNQDCGITTTAPGDYVFTLDDSNSATKVLISVTYPSSVTITLDKQGHGGANETWYAAVNGTIPTPANPTDDNYTFGGWYQEPECTNLWNFSTTVSSATTLYAKWTCDWQLRGSFTSWATNPITMEITDGVASATVSTLSAMTGYTFQFYNTRESQYYGNSGPIITDISNWDYTIADNNNSRLYTGPTGDYTFKLNVSTKKGQVIYPTVDHPAAGYAYFKQQGGWTGFKVYNFTSNDYRMTDWDGSPSVTNTTTICGSTYYYFALSTDFTYVMFRDNGTNKGCELAVSGFSGKYTGEAADFTSASWHSFTTYTISFAANGASSSMSSLTVGCGTDKQITANSFIYTGHTFLGWKADVNVTIGGATVTAGTLIADAATIQNVRSDIALTAQWETKTTTITLNKNGGGGGTTNVTATYGEDMPSLSTVPTQTAYAFLGYWDTSASSGGTQYYNADKSSAHVWDKEDATFTLYARWSQNKDYFIDAMHGTIDANGNYTGTGREMTGSYTAPSLANQASGNECETAHYIFVGWQTGTPGDNGALNNNKIYRPGESMTAGNKIYYAVWAEE